MCLLSVVTQAGAEQFGWDGRTNIFQGFPQIERVPSPEEWEAFKELCEKAKKFDELTGQADCEKPELITWLQDLEERLEELEDWRKS